VLDKYLLVCFNILIMSSLSLEFDRETTTNAMPNEHPDIMTMRQMLGLTTFLDNEALGVEPSTPLPMGYAYASASSMSVNEFAELETSVEVFGLQSPYGVMNDFAARRRLGIQTIEVGVRSNAVHKLVGHGALQLLDSLGLLSDFAVRPGYRSRGIGRAIIDERLMQADRLGIEELRVRLEPTNTLRSYYEIHGFQARKKDPQVLVRTVSSRLSTVSRRSSSSVLYRGLEIK
jgi:N-acetylglutamate synthase-like GNAT family acetyltransferase